MDFFEQQERSKKYTSISVTLFFLAAFGVCFALAYISCVMYLLHTLYYFRSSLSPFAVFSNFPFVAIPAFIVSFAVIAAASMYKIAQLKYGCGEKIAMWLLATRITRKSASANEIMLLNIVDELAIASGTPSPPVFILKNDNTVNAFAAGMSTDDAVIGVTKGAVDYLTRDELQGVLAHEFSHILNGDMRLNTQIIGVLHGITFIGYMGKEILVSAARDKDGDNSLSPFVFIAGPLFIIGYAGCFLGTLIKAFINRQREYLADASAVQFTRYPKGLANALKKAGGAGSTITSKSAGAYSHLFFVGGVKNFFSFSVHPPLDERIRALDPKWDGIYILPDPVLFTENAIKKHNEAKRQEEIKERWRKWDSKEFQDKIKKITLASVLSEIDVSKMKPKRSKTVKKEKNTIGGIPQNLYDRTADTQEAQLLVFCIFLDEKEKIRKIQREVIAKAYFEENAESAEKFETICAEGSLLRAFTRGHPECKQKALFKVQKYPRDLYLNLVYISIPTLKTLSKAEYLKFKETLIKLIEADNKVSWSELNLKYLILYPLDIALGIRKPARETCLYIGAMKRDAEVLLSKFTHHQFNDDELARSAFNKTVASFGAGALKYIPSQNISIADLENAYNATQTAKLPLKKKIFEIAAACLKTDGELSAHDTETLHALASLLHLPPPSRS